jgi:hypothetical protein
MYVFIMFIKRYVSILQCTVFRVKKMKGYTSSGHEHPILAYISVSQLFSFAATDSIRF